MKLARIDITTFETADLFVFRRAVKRHAFFPKGREAKDEESGLSSGSTVSDLPLKPKEMSNTGKLLYKWVQDKKKNMTKTFVTVTSLIEF